MRKVIGTTRLLALCLLLSVSACGGDGGDAGPIDLTAVSTNLQGTAPDVFRARIETSKGDFVVEVTRAWSPGGADRFYNLVSHGYLDGVRFFRVIAGFMAQFGINGDPALAALLSEDNILDDPIMESNTRGKMTFAMTGQPNSRSTQMFINLVPNTNLDALGFSPFGEIVEGMEVVDQLYSGYGEGAPGGSGPNQGRIQTEGNAYLNADFPNLDYVERASIER
jgi:peptidyl-prolyl cis-trans isomerase A (cyclophilin A)